MLFDPTSLATLNPALIAALAIWSVAWKGLALWRAAHREEKIWFVVLLVVNTVGILEIVYLVITRGKNKPKSSATMPQKSEHDSMKDSEEVDADSAERILK